MVSTAVDRRAGLSANAAIKGPCVLASVANLALAGLAVVDGVATAEGDRILVRAQSNATENGIYIASAGDWERAKDFKQSNDLAVGSLFVVSGGATLANNMFILTYSGEAEVGATAFTINLFLGGSATLLLALLLTVDGAGSGLDADKLDGNDSSYFLSAGDAAATYLSIAAAAAGFQPLDADLTAIAALATTAHGRALLTRTAAEDVRLSEVVPTFVTTRVALKALDTTKDIRAYFDGSVWEWTAGDLSTQVTLDTTGAVYLKANAIATSAGAWVRQYRTALEVAWFGAVNDGVTDCAAAFTAAMAFVTSTTGSWRELHIPAGHYLFSSQVATTIDNHDHSEEFALCLRGDGPSTVLINGNSTGLLSWVQGSARDIGVYMRDINIKMAAGGNNGTIINFSQVSGGLSRQSDIVIERVNIFPSDITLDYFNYGIRALGFYWPKIRDVNIANPYGPGVTTATQHQGTAAMDFLNSYGPEIQNCKVWGGAKGLSYVVTDNPGGEGGFIDNCVFDSDIGIYIESAGVEPGFTISRSHCNCATKGIWINKKKMGSIQDCLFYNEEVTTYIDVDLDGCEDVTVKNNRFHFAGNTGRTHIDLDASCKRIYMEENKHRSDGTAMHFASGADEVFVSRPYYNSEVDTEISDSGATNFVLLPLRKKFVQWGLSAAISIADSILTTVTWSSAQEQYPASGWGSPGQTVTIPSNVGIRRVSVSVQGSWGNNSTGNREIRITKNGAIVNGSGHIYRSAAATSYMQVEAIFPVADGDVIRVQVSQTSGVAQNFGGTDSWFRVEEVQ